MKMFSKIKCLAIATCIEGIRQKMLWSILIIGVILTTVNIGVTTLFTWDLGKVAIEFGLSAVAFTGLLVVFFLGLKVFSDDLERSRIQMLLSRPLDVWQYILGKFIGVSLLLLFSSFILGLSTVLSMKYIIWQYPAYIPPNFSWLIYLKALISQWMCLLMVLSLTIFWFSFASQPLVALILSVTSYLVGQNIELLKKVVTENTSAGLLEGKTVIINIVSWIFPNLALFDKKYVAAYGFPFGNKELIYLILYALSYNCILLFLSNIAYRRKDLA